MFEAVGWAMSKRLQCGPKMVLIVLCNHSDEIGAAWPSIRRIALQAGMTDRAVSNHLNALEEAGLIRIHPRFRGDGSRTSNKYEVRFPGHIVLTEGGEMDASHPLAMDAAGGEINSPLEPVIETINKETVSIKKEKNGRFGNVLLTLSESTKLKAELGESFSAELVEELSEYVASSGKRYKSHYATLLNWSRRKQKGGSKFNGQDRLERNKETARQFMADGLRGSVAEDVDEGSPHRLPDSISGF